MNEKKIGISRDLLIHPGETIADVLEERGITQVELVARTGVSSAYVSNVIAGKKNISADFAFALEYALGVPKTFWLNLQANYDAEILEINGDQSIMEENMNTESIHPEIDLIRARKAFDRYLRQFDREDPKIKLKIIHTEGVVCCMREICRRMKLSETECQVAELIALLHDIGRFEQLKQFDSFERSTMDHAAYGVQLLFGEQKMIRQFIETDAWDSCIREAIARHSDYSGYDNSLGDELLYVLLIRDADKLDNCRVKLEESIEVMIGCTAEEMGRQEISREVWEECISRKSVHLEKRKTKMDYWASYIAYFFDIAYPETMDIIEENQYVERIIRRIPYSNSDTEHKMWKLYELVRDYFTMAKSS